MMFKAFTAALAVGLAAAAAPEIEEGVTVGTDTNFDEIIAANDVALVEFYAPWCGHCKSLAPEYAKAATELVEKSIPALLVKVDATVETKVAERFEVQGYPTLKLFMSGTPVEYEGGRTSADIVSFLKKKTGPPATSVSTVKDIEAEMASSGNVVVLGVFADEEGEEASVFKAAAAASSFSFVITTSADVAGHYGIAAPAITVLTDFDEKQFNFAGEFVGDAITEHVAASSLPLIIEFTEETAPTIFGGAVKQHFLLFADSAADTFAGLKEALATPAKEHKGKLLFITMDISIESNGQIMEFFGIAETDCPTVRIIDVAEDMVKFAPDFTEVSAETMAKFAASFVAGELKPSRMSEDTPEDWDAEDVKVVTGGNFDDVVKNPETFAFVEFYAPWCGHCKSLAPIYDELATLFKGEKSVVIAKCDATKNEIEGFAAESFPTIKLVTMNNEVKDYEGERDLPSMVEYLNTETGTAIEVPTPAAGDADAPDGSEDESHDEL